MKSLFSITEKEKNNQSYMVFVLAVLWALVQCFIVSMGFIFLPNLWMRWVIFIGLSLLISATTLLLNKLNYTRIASIALPTGLWLLNIVSCYSGGGIMATGILSQMSIILTAGFLLGWRGGLAIGLLTMGTDFWLAYLQTTGNLPIPSVNHTPITRWISNVIPFGTIIALQYYATNHISSSLISLKHEIAKREDAEKITNKTVNDLKERVKELKTLYAVSRILQNEDIQIKKLIQQIAEILPMGWQYPEITAAKICFGSTMYSTKNYKSSAYKQKAELKTENGYLLSIEVVYLEERPESDEGQFLKEERNLINMLVEMVKINLDRRERRTELKDYKYALDLGSMVSISDANECFTFVNDNFCKGTKYSAAELIGKDYSFIMSDFHTAEYLKELKFALQSGKPYKGEFCNKAKDGTLYWVDTTIVPFLDDQGKVYQYLSINYNITERKEADDKIRESEKLLKKITDQIPSNTYIFDIEESGASNMLFMSLGKDTFNIKYNFDDLSEHPEILREVLYESDKLKFNGAMKEGFKTQQPLNFQYRIVINGNIRWRWMQASPEKDKNGKILWYGASTDITPLVEYIASTEQIIFDISHVIRRPVSSMLGLTKLIIDADLTDEEVVEMSKNLYLIAEEMDKFIKELNHVYTMKRQNTELNIDISSLIDQRNSLFS